MPATHTGAARLGITRVAMAVLAGSLLGSTASILVLGNRVRSRDQIVATARARPPATVTVAATRRRIVAGVTFRATPDANGATGAMTLPQAVAGVVTAVAARPGGTLRAGSVPVEVQGRPVVVLPGAFRFYRDLAPGDRGPDVAQLQRALTGMGLAPGAERGIYGPATSTAVAALYRRTGYEPPAGAPARELWAIPTLPMRIGSVSASVGTVIAPDTATIARALDGSRLRGVLPAAGAQPVTVGSRASVADDRDGKHYAARVVGVVAATGDGEGPAVLVRLDDRRVQLPGERSYRVDVTGSQTATPVLAVPVTGIQTRADGTTFVSVESGTSRVVDVPVDVGLQGAGWAAVRTSDPALREGARVVVGGSADRAP